MPIFCAECGNQLDTEDKFCGRCGSSAKQQKSTGSTPPTEDQWTRPKEPFTLYTWKSFFAGVIIIWAVFSLQKQQADTAAFVTGIFDTSHICKATISKIMAQPTSIIRVDKTSGGITYISYNRPRDGSYWGYKCKLSGDRAIWASNSGDVTGRWRDSPSDERITFRVKGNILTITEVLPDRTGTSQTFSAQDLGIR